MREAPHSHPGGHIKVLAGHNAQGEPVTEVIPAASVDDGVYEVLGTPGLAHGCSAGDVLRLASNGEFEVLERGGNIAIHVYMRGLTIEAVEALRVQFADLNALVEAPDNLKFAVVTVPAAAGFDPIERAIHDWHAMFPEAEWLFGNVYDEDGSPLNWW